MMTRFDICNVRDDSRCGVDNFNALVSFFTAISPEEFINYYIKDNEFGYRFTPIDIISEL